MARQRFSHFSVFVISFIALVVGITTGILWNRDRATVVPASEKKPGGLTRLSAAFQRERFVAYSPTQYNPLNRDAEPVSEQSIRADLLILRPYFSAIITYSCASRAGLDRIVNVAQELEMRVVLGIWDVRSVTEIETAVRL